MDLRDYLEELKKHGELKETGVPVHWDEEAVGLAAMNNRAGGPALHFKDIVGYNNASLVSNLFSLPGSLFWRPGKKPPWGKLAIALRLDPYIDYESLMAELIARRRQPVLPTKTTAGECKEVVMAGGEVDLHSLPFTRQTVLDGGRYGTAGIVVGKDYGSDWASWGIHRFMIQGRDTAVLNVNPNSHLAGIFAKYEKNNENMPVCIFFGADPACFIAAAMPLPMGMSETEIAGAFAQDPIELIKAETNDLLIPADAELIIEGELLAGVRQEEGPFPEYSRLAEKTMQPVLKVKAITCRKNPIIPFIAEGCKVSDSMTVLSIGASLELYLMVTSERFFNVRWINLPVEMKLGVCVVASKSVYKGHNFLLSKFMHSRKRRMFFDKLVIVDSDIEPVDMWEICNELYQKQDPRVIEGGVWIDTLPTVLSPVAAWANDQERALGIGQSVTLNISWPEAWTTEEIPVRCTFENSFPPEIQQRVMDRWKKLDLPGEPWQKPISEKWSRALIMAR